MNIGHFRDEPFQAIDCTGTDNKSTELISDPMHHLDVKQEEKC